MPTTQFYDDALTILDALITEEDNFHRAARLNSIIIELAILRATADAPEPEPKPGWQAQLDLIHDISHNHWSD